jgi:hypothetical protein
LLKFIFIKHIVKVLKICLHLTDLESSNKKDIDASEALELRPGKVSFFYTLNFAVQKKDIADGSVPCGQAFALIINGL